MTEEMEEEVSALATEIYEFTKAVQEYTEGNVRFKSICARKDMGLLGQSKPLTEEEKAAYSDALRATARKYLINRIYAVVLKSAQAAGFTEADMRTHLLEYVEAKDDNIKYREARRARAENEKRKQGAIEEARQIFEDDNLTLDEKVTGAMGILGSIKPIIKCISTHEPSWEEMEYDYLERSEGYMPVILDGLIFPNDTLSFIGARSSRGKTTFMTTLAIDALHNGRKVIFITLEEIPKKIQRRLVMCEAYYSAAPNIRLELDSVGYDGKPDPMKAYREFIRNDGKLPAESNLDGGAVFYDCMDKARGYLKNLHSKGRLSIYNATYSTDRKALRYKLLQAEQGDIVLFDYIQRSPGNGNENGDTDILRIRKTNSMLIEVAQITGCVVIAGAQFNRNSTGVKGEGTALDSFNEASFKDCGDIEQDATIAIGIGWDNSDADRQKRFYTILKNREGGGVGNSYDLDFSGAYSYMASTKVLRNTNPIVNQSKNTKKAGTRIITSPEEDTTSPNYDPTHGGLFVYE